jgi:hypothetical protein
MVAESRKGVTRVILYLWETATACGVTDDRTRAMDAAAETTDDGCARVDRARLTFGMTSRHVRLGDGWVMRDGQWVPFSLPGWLRHEQAG